MFDEHFDSLFSQLETFSPTLDDDDLFAPVSSSSRSPDVPNVAPCLTSPHALSPPPIPSSPSLNLRFVSQNAMKSNYAIHSLLNVSSSGNFVADIILIQEPWFGRIGIDVISGHDILGCPSHPDWQCILPPFGNLRPDVAIYVPKSHPSWTIEVRTDLISHPSILLVDITTLDNTFHITNVYNPSDCSSLPPLVNIPFPDNHKSIIAGDFNLHHPLWSRADHHTKISPESEQLVDALSLKNFFPVNCPGVETFFREDYSSVLDLVWASFPVSPYLSNFLVNRPMHCGSDHYPLTWSLSFHPLEDPPHNFLFTDENSEFWDDAFLNEMTSWQFPDYITSPAVFHDAVDHLMDAMLSASISACVRKNHSPKSAKWFNKEVHLALSRMRKARSRCQTFPSRHNVISYQLANAQFRFEVKRSKRSHALAVAQSVTANTDLWRLNSWYRGVRKSVTPALKRPDQSWAASSSEKTEVLSHAWFPPPADIPGEFPPPVEPLPCTRRFFEVTRKEIDDAIDGTSNTSAPGISGLNYKVLKWAYALRPVAIRSVIEASIRLGIHHPRWKSALVVAVPKPGKKDYSSPRSHRPIQLIECLGKLVEKIVAKRLTFDAGKFDLLPFNQFGGRSNSSCLDAGLSLTHDIQTARHKGLVSSFLAVDIKGFFDHVHHDRMIHILWKKGFPLEICRWVRSFLSDRSIKIRVDDFTSPLSPLHIGLPQGSPVSPSLSCLYAAEPLQSLNSSPIFSSTNHPVGPRSYIDDLGFLAISDSLSENVILLSATLDRALSLFGSIGMSFDPDKSELMHFSWRKGPSPNPPLVSSINDVQIRLTAPKSIRWLGFHLDSKLSFNEHVKIMSSKGSNIVSGLSCLGNSVRGMTPANLRLLYKTCVIPVITYGCQLWYRKDSPRKRLMDKLRKVQNTALRWILGAFRTTPNESLTLLSFCPPIHVTVRKLCDSNALRNFRLPLSSEISHRLPKEYLPPNSSPPPLHVPFPRPILEAKKTSHLVTHALTTSPATERSEPFHSHCAPHSFHQYSPEFSGRFSIRSTPCNKEDRKSLVSEQNISFLAAARNKRKLIVFTDGSKMSQGSGYGIAAFYLGKRVFSLSIPFALHASNFDAEMYALAHASDFVRRKVYNHSSITEVQFYCDTSSALESIFDPSPHPAQDASILFRVNIYSILTRFQDVKITLTWTPGHKGTKGMDLVDRLAKKGAKSKRKDRLLSFTSRSSALAALNVKPCHDGRNTSKITPSVPSRASSLPRSTCTPIFALNPGSGRSAEF